MSPAEKLEAPQLVFTSSFDGSLDRYIEDLRTQVAQSCAEEPELEPALLPPVPAPARLPPVPEPLGPGGLLDPQAATKLITDRLVAMPMLLARNCRRSIPCLRAPASARLCPSCPYSPTTF